MMGRMRSSESESESESEFEFESESATEILAIPRVFPLACGSSA
jgi:hypothetical protein